MATDNTAQNATDNIATDDILTMNGTTIGTGTAKAQRVKVGYGDDSIFRDVSASFPLPATIMGDPDITAAGTITATDAVVAAPAGAGATVTGASTTGSIVAVSLAGGGGSVWTVQIAGQTTGNIWFEESLDSTTGTDGNWINVNGRQTGVVNTVLAGSSVTSGVYRGNASGAKYFRVRQTGTLTGTPAVTIRVSSGTGAVFLNASIPAGSNTIGGVTIAGSGGLATTSGAITAAVANTPGSAVTASTTAQVVASTPLAGNATFHLVTSAFVGTVTFEGSVDGGLNYGPIQAIREDGTGSENTLAISTAAAFIRQYTVALPGLAYFRVRCSAFTSGSVTVLIAPGPTLIEPNPSLSASSAQIGTVAPRAADLAVTVTAAAASAATLTLPAVVGAFHYLSSLTIVKYATAALTAGATPVLVTSTNLPGSPVWTFGSAGAIGTNEVQSYTFPQPVKSSVVNTATTVVAPATTAVLWRITATYYAA